MWQPKGKKGTIKIRTNTGRNRITILGTVNIKDHSILTTLTKEPCNAERIIEFFQKIRDAYPLATKIVIVLDNARYNHANATRDFAEKNNMVQLFLPPYAPNLNLAERLWKFSKKHLVNNTYHEKFSLFVDATETFFNRLDDFQDELVSLFSQKFQIIHAE